MKFFKNKPNNELNKTSKAKLAPHPVAVKNPGKEAKRKVELAEVERYRGEVLKAIANQAELKIKQQEVISRAEHNINYNQNKVDKMQVKLKELELKYNLFHKRQAGL